MFFILTVQGDLQKHNSPIFIYNSQLQLCRIKMFPFISVRFFITFSVTRGWGLFDLQTRVENVEDHLDHINERLDHFEMAQRKNAIRVEVEELRKTVLNLLISAHNDTIAAETTPRRYSSADLSFFVAMGGCLAMIVVLGVVIVALLCHNRRLLTRQNTMNDIEMADISSPINVFEPEPEPIESAVDDEPHTDEEGDEQPQPQPLFLIGSAAIHFSQRPSSLAVVRGFELPAPIASFDSE